MPAASKANIKPHARVKSGALTRDRPRQLCRAPVPRTRGARRALQAQYLSTSERDATGCAALVSSRPGETPPGGAYSPGASPAPNRKLNRVDAVARRRYRKIASRACESCADRIQPQRTQLIPTLFGPRCVPLYVLVNVSTACGGGVTIVRRPPLPARELTSAKLNCKTLISKRRRDTRKRAVFFRLRRGLTHRFPSIAPSRS